MRTGGGDVLVGPGYRTAVEFRPGTHVYPAGLGSLRIDRAEGQRVVRVERPRVTPVRIAMPHVVGAVVVAIDVVPTRVDDHAAIVDAGVELVGLVEVDGVHVASVGLDRKHREGRNRPAVTATKPVPPRRHEDNPPIGQPERIEIIEDTVGQAGEPFTVDADLEDAEPGLGAPFRLDAAAPGKEYRLAVEGKIRRDESSFFHQFALVRAAGNLQALHDVHQVRDIGFVVLQDEQPPAGPAVMPVVLIAEMIAIVLGFPR